MPAAVIEKAQHACDLRDAGLQRALVGGVRFAYGTDCGVFPHDQTLLDFAVLGKLGMAPIDLLKSATVNAAALLGKNDRGRIAPDLLADIVAFAGDPTADISAMQTGPSFVMLGGKRLA